MRLRRFIRSGAYSAAALLLLCITPGTVWAAQAGQKDQLALGVYPAITEQVLDAGQSKSIVIAVTNLTDSPLPVRGTVAPLTVAENVADKDRQLFDASKWVQLATPDFILQARQQKTVTVSLSPPPNAEPGGHYATIFFQPLVPALPNKASAVYIGSKVGVLTFMTVKGAIEEKTAIAAFRTTPLKQSGPIKFTMQLRNTGNVHLMPTGIVKIYDAFGHTIKTLPMPPTIVLPKTTKNLAITWDNKKRIGYYTARATVTFGSKRTQLTSQDVHVLIFPWLSATAMLTGAIVAILVMWRTHERWRRALNALLKGEPKYRR